MHKIKTFLTSLSFERSWRGDCPVCGGSNTLSVTRESGKLWYYCFRNSCKVGGTIEKESSYDEVRENLRQCGAHTSNSSFRMPEYWVPLRDSHCNYLDHYGSLEAYLSGRVDCKYDPKLNRLVFLIGTSGAVGRALDKHTQPKWYIYHEHNNIPLVVPGRHSFNVIVEDALSSCSVARVSTSTALLGTRLDDRHIHYLRDSKHILIALDKDASVKALEMQHRLQQFCGDVKVWLLERDLKYESKEWIEGMIENKFPSTP